MKRKTNELSTNNDPSNSTTIKNSNGSNNDVNQILNTTTDNETTYSNVNNFYQNFQQINQEQNVDSNDGFTVNRIIRNFSYVPMQPIHHQQQSTDINNSKFK